jgi:hypothetical protein
MLRILQEAESMDKNERRKRTKMKKKKRKRKGGRACNWAVSNKAFVYFFSLFPFLYPISRLKRTKGGKKKRQDQITVG